MASEESGRQTRILVALESRGRDHAALQLGAEIAALWHSELVAVCIEAHELAQAPAFPFALEIDRVSAARREIDPARLLNAFRIWRRQIDQQLARLASAHRIAASSAVIQGTLWRETIRFAGTADLLLIGSASITSARPRPRVSRPIAVLLFGTPRDSGALDVALALGRRFETGLIAWSVALDRKTTRRIYAAIDALASAEIEARAIAEPVRLAGMLDDARCRWLVASRQDLTQAGIDLHEFLNKPNRTAFLVP
jgi:hypothetical protein